VSNPLNGPPSLKPSSNPEPSPPTTPATSLSLPAARNNPDLSHGPFRPAGRSHGAYPTRALRAPGKLSTPLLDVSRPFTLRSPYRLVARPVVPPAIPIVKHVMHVSAPHTHSLEDAARADRPERERRTTNYAGGSKRLGTEAIPGRVRTLPDSLHRSSTSIREQAATFLTRQGLGGATPSTDISRSDAPRNSSATTYPNP